MSLEHSCCQNMRSTSARKLSTAQSQPWTAFRPGASRNPPDGVPRSPVTTSLRDGDIVNDCEEAGRAR